MGKEKDKKAVKMSSKSAVVKITESLNKRGEIRGTNKKETKNLVAMCPHHKITKKGKKRSTLYPVSDKKGVYICSMCGRKVVTHIYTKEEAHEAVNKTRTLLDQARFFVEAGELGNDTAGYLARLSVDIAHLPKTYNKIAKAVVKSDNIKKHKKKGKHGNGGFTNEDLGSWRM